MTAPASHHRFVTPTPNPNRTLMGVGPLPLPAVRVARASLPGDTPAPAFPIAEAHASEVMATAPLVVHAEQAPAPVVQAPLVAAPLPSPVAPVRRPGARVTDKVRTARSARAWPLVAMAATLALAAAGVMLAMSWDAGHAPQSPRSSELAAMSATQAPRPAQAMSPVEGAKVTPADPRAWWNQTMAVGGAGETAPRRPGGRGGMRASERRIARSLGGSPEGAVVFGPQPAPGVAESISTTIRGQVTVLK